MGMFDWINFKCKCPVCGSVINGFQSKDRECILETIPYYYVDNFYDSCDECGAWVEFDLNFRIDYTLPQIPIEKYTVRVYKDALNRFDEEKFKEMIYDGNEWKKKE